MRNVPTWLCGKTKKNLSQRRHGATKEQKRAIGIRRVRCVVSGTPRARDTSRFALAAADSFVLPAGHGRRPQGQVFVALLRTLIQDESNLPEAIPALQVALARQVPDAVTVAALRRCVNRGCPFAEDSWQNAMVEQLGPE